MRDSEVSEERERKSTQCDREEAVRQEAETEPGWRDTNPSTWHSGSFTRLTTYREQLQALGLGRHGDSQLGAISGRRLERLLTSIEASRGQLVTVGLRELERLA